MNIRTPPTEAQFALHLPKTAGKCRWCGLPVNEESRFGGRRRLWHDACEREFRIVVDPGYARTAVFQRDHGVCEECGEDWSAAFRWQVASVVWVADDGHSWFEGAPTHSPIAMQTHYQWTLLRKVSLWHVDHRVPLWKVQHIEPLKRLYYWTLKNLQTLCENCHKRKSAREEAEKAKYDRRERAKTAKPKPKRTWGSRSMRSKFKPRVRDINDE